MTAKENNGTKRALLVGINKYKYSYINDLHGCLNDVKLMKTVLVTKFGFDEQNIAYLTDEKATRSAILDAFDKLVATTEKNDLVVFHYSGHGSQITDQEGDELDGLDETILPHDTGRSCYGDHNHDISDDYIYGLIKRLNAKTPYVTMIFDSCHSGTMSRDLFGDADRWVEPDNPQPGAPNYHFLPPPYDDEAIVAELKAEREGSRNIGDSSGWLPQGDSYVLIAGCRDEERAFEFFDKESETRHGMLTYFLCQELMNASPNTSYRSVFEKASAKVTLHKPSQHPQMEGKRDRELFGAAMVQTMRYLSVDKRDGNQVILKGGAAHGMTKGSQWAIYSAETNEVTSKTPRLGLVEIKNVSAVIAIAEILTSQSETPDMIKGGCRAVEYAHNYGSMQLPITFDVLDDNFAADVTRMRQWIDNSQLLHLTEDTNEAQWNLVLLPPRAEITKTTRAPQLGLLDETMWVVILADGQLQPAHRAADPGSKYKIFENLEKSARYDMALNKVENPNPDNVLRDVIKVTFKHKNANNEWVNADPKDNPLIYHEGELLGLVIENVADRLTQNREQSVFISVLNFGLTGAINLLHPIEGASEELKPGNKIEIGIRDDDQIPVSIPQNFPGEKREGIDRIKLFITSQPAHFSGFIQDSWRDIREARPGDSPLEQLMALALTNHNRDVLRSRPQPIDSWLTQTYEYIVRR